MCRVRVKFSEIFSQCEADSSYCLVSNEDVLLFILFLFVFMQAGTSASVVDVCWISSHSRTLS